jgi:hypothetical protein
MEVVFRSERFTVASTPRPRGRWGHEGHKKGDKPGCCASRGKEMQIKQTQSVEFLHSKLTGVPVETR